jgi:uncharacterized membrane protein
MIVIYVLTISFFVLECTRYLAANRIQLIKSSWDWQDNLCFSIVLVFIVTGLSHFSYLRYDMLAMLPPPVPREMWVIALTGYIELIGAAALLHKSSRRLTSLALVLLLVCLFPANIYAALNNIPFNGRPVTPLALRTAIQCFLIFLLLWLFHLESKKLVQQERGNHDNF